MPTKYRPSTDQAPHKRPTSTPQASDEELNVPISVHNLLKVLVGEMSRRQLQTALELKHKGNFRTKYLEPALEKGYIKMKFPESPNHSKQKYLITQKGNEVLKKT